MRIVTFAILRPAWNALLDISLVVCLELVCLIQLLIATLELIKYVQIVLLDLD